MLGFNAIQTIQVEAGSESTSVTFTNTACISASQVLIDNEGSEIIYAASGKEVKIPSDEPGGFPIPPMQGRIISKPSGEDTISVISLSSKVKVDISPGQGF